MKEKHTGRQRKTENSKAICLENRKCKTKEIKKGQRQKSKFVTKNELSEGNGISIQRSQHKASLTSTQETRLQ